MDGWVWNGVEALAVALSSTLDSAAETPPRARFRNSRTPAGFKPKGWPIGLRTGGRFSTFEPAKSKEWMDGGGSGSFGRGSFDVTALSSTVDSAAETSPRARFRNSRTPAGFRPKGWPIGLRTRGRFSTFEPAKSKERWMDGWMGVEWGGSFGCGPEQHRGFGCRNTSQGTVAEQQNPSRIQAQGVAHWFADQGPFQHLRTSYIKAKRWMDGWMDGWMGVE